MGMFKEQILESYDQTFFQDIDTSLQALELELDALDQKLEIIDHECGEIEKNLNLLLPNFEIFEKFTRYSASSLQST